MTTQPKGMGAIIVTTNEYKAFTSARAMYEVSYEGEEGSAQQRAEFKHLSDLGIKMAQALR